MRGPEDRVPPGGELRFNAESGALANLQDSPEV